MSPFVTHYGSLLRSSSDSCTLIADGDDEEEWLCECDRGEVKRLRSYGGEYGGWGSLERARDEDALREDEGRLCSWLPRRCGDGCEGAGLGGSAPVVVVLMLDAVGDFPSILALAAETEEAPNDARLVMTGFLKRPRN